jgi:ATP-dependent helicase/nuclease subunit B
MSTRILLAPVGAGKTENVLTQLAERLRQHPFDRVWVVLASSRQEDAFRQRLIEWEPGRRVWFNVEFFNFYNLYQHLLDDEGTPYRQIGEAARFRLLRQRIASLRHELTVFGEIAHTPGFIRITGEFIYELKQSRIDPLAFQRAARSEKDHDLARIYAAYQANLQHHGLVDREGQGWLAVEALDKNPRLAADLALLIVDGFDQFTPVQVDLLAALARRADESLITLTTVSGRERTVGRRFSQALERLQARFDSPPTVEEIGHAAAADRHPDLQHVIVHAFQRNPLQRASSGGIKLIEAPDPAAEVGAVLRRVKRLLLDSIPPDEILIVLRDWERYRPHFTLLRRKYGLPLALHYGEPLAENPAVIALLNLLRLHATDFRRRDVIDVLRSPYFRFPQLDAAGVDLLDRISRELIITGGRELWLQAIRQAEQMGFISAGEGGPLRDGGEDEVGVRPDDATIKQLYDGLQAFFALVTPPVEADVSGYIQWLAGLIGPDPDRPPREEDELADESPADHGPGMIACARAMSAGDEIVARDLLALQGVQRVLRELLSAHDLLYSLDAENGTVIDWGTFQDDLLAAIHTTAINPRPSHTGQVLVTAATDARGLPHRYVFILGLNEGLFPAPLSEDPLYLDSERRQLQDAGIPLLQRSERAADDGVFYELICLPRERLTLSRPTVQEGKPWIESALWRAVSGVFADRDELLQRDRVAIGQTVAAEEAAARDEAAVAVADALSSPAGEVAGQVWPVHAWLQTAEPGYWDHIRAGRGIEMGRLSPAPHDRYSGRLEDPRLIEWVAARLGPYRRWSASQLNDFGLCAFRFFAKRLLKLDALEEPEEGMDALQHGTLNHEILEQTYTHIREAGLGIVPENLDQALGFLREAAARVFAEAPARLGFRASGLWEQEQTVILRRLEHLLRFDFGVDGDNPAQKFGTELRRPYLLEAAFGKSGDVRIDLGDDAGPLLLSGLIDRIDRQGHDAVIIDYKTQSGGIPTSELATGRNFQMMVYLEGARALLAGDPDAPSRVAGGLFLHIRSRKASGVIQLDSENDMEALEGAREHLRHNLAQGRRGDFAVHPGRIDQGRCAQYCDFHHLCRVSATHRGKR